MARTLLCSLVALLLVGGNLFADDKNTKDAKHGQKKCEAKITKVDPKKGTVTVQMHDKKTGKDTERTFNLTEEVRYVDSTGKVAAADLFRSGDEVLVVEEEGHLKEMHKQPADKEHKDKSNASTSGAGKKSGGK